MTSVLLDRSPYLLERLDVPADEPTAWREPGEGESFLYVIAGEGVLELSDGGRPLAHESVVWLEAGDRHRLTAGEGGLAVLAVTVEGRSGK